MDVQKVTREVRLHQWSNLLKECQSSGMNVKNWCSTQGINTRVYYYWLKKARESACREMEAYHSKPLQQPISEKPIFAEVSRLPVKTVAIMVRLEGVEVEIHNGADASVIENTIRVLKSIC
jgi:hypothetical protein